MQFGKTLYNELDRYGLFDNSETLGFGKIPIAFRILPAILNESDLDQTFLKIAGEEELEHIVFYFLYLPGRCGRSGPLTSESELEVLRT